MSLAPVEELPILGPASKLLFPTPCPTYCLLDVTEYNFCHHIITNEVLKQLLALMRLLWRLHREKK